MAFGYFDPHRMVPATRRELTVHMKILLFSWKDILFDGCLKKICVYIMDICYIFLYKIGFLTKIGVHSDVATADDTR